MTRKAQQHLRHLLLYILIFFLLSYVLVGIFAPGQAIKIFGFKTYVVVSPSMEPDINVLDAVVVIRTPAHRLEPGQAITFMVYLPELGDYAVVTHYLVAIEEVDGATIYKTQGAEKEPDDVDQWRDPDGNPVDLTADDIIGRVWLTIPQAGKIMIPLSNPMMMIMILLNIVVIVTLVKVIKKK